MTQQYWANMHTNSSGQYKQGGIHEANQGEDLGCYIVRRVYRRLHRRVWASRKMSRNCKQALANF